MATIGQSVGRGGTNARRDVSIIQALLNANINRIAPRAQLPVNGQCGGPTIAAIEAFQRRVVGMKSPDGRVDPNGGTLKKLNEGAPQGVNVPMPEIPVESLPFTVGRTPGPGEASARVRIDLMLDDARPYRLSRAHFRIERGNGGYLVRDLGSVLGTTVNRRPIGQHFADDTAPLQPGENSILAGGEESPFRFRLDLGGA